MKFKQPRNVSAPVRGKKRSDYARYYERPAEVVAPTPMESTDLGSRAEGYKGEFEVEYELLARNTITSTMYHPKKERLLKVLEGSGELTLTTDDGESKTVALRKGEDVVLAAETQYFVSSHGTLYLMFVQPKSYKARLQVLNEPKIPETKELPTVRTVEEVAGRRRGSRAVEQQKLLAQARNEKLGIREQPEALGRAPTAGASSGAPMPSFGSDLPGEPG